MKAQGGDQRRQIDTTSRLRMSEAQLFDELNALELCGTEHLSSRHKPLTLLWMIGRIADGRRRLVSWREFRERMPSLLKRYGRPLPDPDLRYPFWDLRTSPLWEIVGIEENLSWPYTPSIRTFDSKNPSAGFISAAATLLSSVPVRDRAIKTLTARFFTEDQSDALMKDFGLTSTTLTARSIDSRPHDQSLANDQCLQVGERNEGFRAQSARMQDADTSFVSAALDSPSQGPTSQGRTSAEDSSARAGNVPSTTDQMPIRDNVYSSAAIVTARANRTQGRRQDAVANRAVELHAENLAERYFEERGWTVERVGRLRLGFDLLCRHPAQGVLHVEVKGTQTRGEEVILTPNEVHHNLDLEHCDADHALYVVADIQLLGPGDIECTGGREYCFWPWHINGSTLTPTQYLYKLPVTQRAKGEHATRGRQPESVTSIIDGFVSRRETLKPSNGERVEFCPACGIAPSNLGRCRCS
ncbi:protein NO VEIN domain-containing protein [Plantactinospora veratri]|uniref:protein NO VEIN domain-containing protein n=1 Tax=Plantactinospora veratri TaxID=1436122 RepID=UPI0038B508CC